MDFKNVPKEFRPIPFWSWNEKLNTEETREQIRKMDEAGIGGFFMHARGGLETEYMSEEWHDAVRACIDEARKLGMEAWGISADARPYKDQINFVLVEEGVTSIGDLAFYKCSKIADVQLSDTIERIGK